jgi:23S rRNA pseudouridine1911/1915/1917 synthase
MTSPHAVVGDEGPIRVDTFVHRTWPALSRRVVRRILADGAVRVNGRRVRKGTMLAAGDVVALDALPRLAEEPDLPVPIRWEDPSLVVVEKPGGMPAHALDPHQRGTVAAFLLARYPEMAAFGDPLAAGLVHRLDTGTSGLLVAARTAASHAVLRAAFRARAVEKTYLAVVAGRTQPFTRITIALAHDPHDRRRMIAAAPGLRSWSAVTEVETRAIAADRTLVVARMRTGVTHQIRAHLAAVGHPVLGDALYGGPTANLAPGRHALHAAGVSLPHPAGGQLLKLESPLADDLRAVAP